ncbi:MAG TPA: Bcr/CflA family multidrug efflux MFS transporter [Alphaproteobacteria bacterium]|nr:Bcr/CflA family multidrug efflux MFS transporter [Alphaproteobacteria bacterium]
MTTTASAGGTAQPSRENLRIAVLAMLTAFGPMSIDMYLPALPSIARDLGVAVADAQLTLSAFFFGFGAAQLVYGPLADRFGRIRPLVGGLVLFTLASLGCALAHSLGSLIAFRFLQALGGSAGPVLARAIVRDLYDRDRAAHVLSLMVLIMSIAPLFAPLVGGQLLVLWSWRAIFLLLVGFGLLCIAATWGAVGETLHHQRRRGGPVLSMLLSYGVPLSSRRYIGYAVSGALIYGGLFAYLTGTPYVFITLYGVRPEHYGLLFGLNVIGIILAALLNRRIVLRYGVDRLLAAGILVAAIAGVALAVVAATKWGGLTALLVPMFFFLASLGMVGANSMAGCLGLFPERAGVASALAGTLQFGMGAVSGTLISVLADGTALPMAGTMGAVGVLSLAVQRWLAPAKASAAGH